MGNILPSQTRQKKHYTKSKGFSNRFEHTFDEYKLAWNMLNSGCKEVMQMKRFFLVVACLALAFFVAGSANSATLSLDYLIGTVAPDLPADPSDEFIYANALITWYNGGTDPNGGTYVYTLGPDATGVPGSPGSGSLEPATETGGVKFSSAEVAGGVSLTGYTYLMAKFGTDGALYYLDGSITSLTGFDPAWGPFTLQEGRDSLSHITLFGGGTTLVPESGALILLGTGLIGLVGYRRVRRMR
jgi:hypothetical protein